MRKLFFVFLLSAILFLGFSTQIFAQISKGGIPPSFVNSQAVSATFDVIDVPAIDVNAVMQEDALKGGPLWAGRTIPVDYDMTNSGTWSDLPDGRKIWRLKFTSSGAKGLGVLYNDFYIPEGGKLFLYNETKNQVIGAFTSENNPSEGIFSTELIQGQTVTLEYVSPKEVKTKPLVDEYNGTINGNTIINNNNIISNLRKPSLSISGIIYLYKESPLVEKYNLTKQTGWGTSLPCEVNVNCSEGTSWQTEKKGVAEIWLLSGGSWGWCTGTLINTTNNSGTPYFLTADHCHSEGGITATAAEMLQWQFYFKYEGAGCPDPGAEPAYSTLTGCVLKAASPINGGSDFCLVLLNTTPPQTYNPYYNGWDRLNTAATSGVGIHHPSGDIKKISTFTSTLSTSTWNDGTNIGASGAHWAGSYVATTNGWGQTEGGSSGSPIFNSSKRVTGTLTGGTAADCATGSSFDYGKFWYHWDQTPGGTTTQLKTWLDPVSANSNFVNGYDPFGGWPDFYGSPTTVYEGGSVNYTDITNGATSWLWQFEGGSPASSNAQTPPTIIYNQQGTYKVSLTTNTPIAGTQTQEKVGYITVLPGSASESIWCDDFSTPANWTLINHSGVAGQVWAITTAAPVGSYSATNPGKVASTSGGNYALFDSDGITGSNVEQWASVSSNVGVNCSNFEGVTLKFQEAYTKYYDSTLVYISTDDFTTSTRYILHEGYSNNDNSGNPNLYSLDITSAAAGRTNVKVRFTFRSTPSNMGAYAGWGYAWGIDDVCFEGIAAGQSLPQPDFIASSSRKISPGQSVNFIDQSLYATSWLWTFEGGTPSTSTAQNPTNIVYNTQGYYAVTLAAENANGYVTTSKTNYVHVFYDCSFDSNVQPGDGATYYGAPGAPTGYIPGTNTEFASYSYADKYSIGNLIGKVKSLAVGVGLADIVGGTTNVTFTVWDDNAGVPGTVLRTKVVAIKDLQAGLINYINFAPVSVNSTFFAGFQLTNAANMDTFACYLAQGGAGRTNTAYFYNGTSWVTYESKYGVNGSLYIMPEFCFTKPSTNLPDADFFADNTDIALGTNVNFTDQSTGGPVPTTWSWTLTGGTPNSSSVQNPPNINYAAAGLYDVTLNATNANGTDPETKVGYIHVANTVTIVNWTFPNTSANATADVGGIAANNTKLITNWGAPTAQTYATTGAGGGVDKCASTTKWDDANAAPTYAWSVTFTTAGYTNIKLSSKQSATSTSSPRDFAVYYNAGSGYNFLADVHAMTTAGNWTQGVLSNIQLPSECDNNPNVEILWYKTSDISANGGAVTAAATSLIDDIIVTGQPCTNLPAAAGVISGTATVCQGQQGVAYSVPVISGATIYNWTLPAGATIATGNYTRNITVNFALNQVAGNITVQGENICGVGTVSSNYAVAVNLVPATPGPITGSQAVTNGQLGVAYSVPVVAGATSYTWTLPSFATLASGSGTRSITANMACPGDIENITVHANNACGAGPESFLYSVIIQCSTPVADFTADATSVTQGSTVNFSDLSTNNPVSWSWTFAGGTPGTSTLKNPSIVYNTPGVYNVSLTATNAVGNNSITKTAYITVSAAPISIVNWDFPNNPDNATADGGIAANLAKTISVQGGVSAPTWSTSGATTNCASAITWNSGNGTKWWQVDFVTTGYQTLTVSSKMAGNNIRSPRDFKVQYKIGAGGTWTDVPNTTINCGTTINNWANANANLSDVALPVACENVASVYLRWIMTSNTGLTGALVQAANACMIDDIIVKGVSISAPVANFSAAPTNVCQGGSVTFTDNSVNAPTTWSWTFAGGTPGTSTSSSPTIVYNTAGTYNVTLVVNGGSSLTRTGYIVVNADPSITAQPGNATICIGGNNTLSVTSTGGVAPGYQWQYNSGTWGNVVNGTPVGAIYQNKTTPSMTVYSISAAGSYQYRCVINYGGSGCTPSLTSNTATLTVGEPTITGTTPGSRCGTGTVTLGATASAGTINWYAASTGGASLGTGTSYTTPSISATTTYYVDATNGGCTTATRTAVTATVNSTPTITGTTPGSRCGTGTVTLGATASAGTINWYAASTGGASLGTGTSYTTPSISATTTYYVDATVGGCTTASRTAVIATVNSEPTITGTTPGSRCDAGTVTLGATASAGTINWYAASTGGASLGTGTSYTTPSISATTTYYVDATNGGCTTATRTAVTATVNTTPTITGTTPGSRCGTGTVTLGATASAGTINWYAASTGGASLGTGTSYTTPSISTTTTYYVDATNGGCTTATRTAVTATVNIIPTITGTTPGSRCGTGTVVLGATASAGTINWYAASTGGASLGTGTSYTTPSISATTTYYVDATNAGCTTASRTGVVATVNTTPTITGTTPGSRCDAGTVTLGATASAGTINWYAASSGGASLGTGISFTTPSIAVTTTYYVDATSGGCTTASRTSVIATVNTTPTISGTTPGSRCDAGTVVLGATASAGTINWYAASTGGASLGTGISYTTPSISATTTYYVDATNGGCTTASRTAVVATVNTTPTITGTTPGSRCGTGTVTLGATASAGTINWYAASTGGASLGTGTSYTTPSISATTSYYVDATNSGCTTGSRTAVVATINTTPSITTTTPGSRCDAGTVTLGATASAGTINWYAASTGGASLGTGTSYTTPSIASTTTYYVDATNAGCTTASRTAVTATVNTTPTITGTTPGSRCDAGTVVLGATGSSGTINWYAASTGGASLGTGTSYTTPSIASTTTYYVDATNTGCTTASRTSVTATVNATPTITGTTPGSRCDAGTVVLGATGSAGTINWYAASTGGASLGTGISYTTPSIASTTTYYVDATNAGCTTASRTGVVATINNSPSISGTTPASRCGTGTVTLGATASAGTINWYAASTGGASLGTGTSYTTPSISATTTYYVDATNAGCTTASRSSIDATVNSAPVIVSESKTDVTICGGSDGSITISATGTAPLTYSINGGTSYFANGGVFTGLASASYPIAVMNGSGCVTTGSTLSIGSGGAPSAPVAGTDATYCSGVLATNLTATAGSGGTLKWYSDPTLLTQIGTGITLDPNAYLTAGANNFYVTETVAGCQSAATTVTITVNALPTITGTTPGSRCDAGTVILGATSSAGTIDWYAASTGGASLGTGTSYTTPSISTTTTYYADATNNGCTTASRTAIVATVYATPTITGTTPGSRCDAGTVTLGAISSSGTINWFALSTGGVSLGTGLSYTTPSISATTTYYVDATNGGCTTVSRTAVVATVNTTPSITTTTPGSRCDAGTVTLGATASAGTINWYANSTGGASLGAGNNYTTPSISVTTTYYADATNNGCTTSSRTAIEATVNATPVITATTPASRCDAGTLVLGASASAGTIDWFSTSSGGVSLSTGTSFTTPNISSTTTYFVEASENGCITASRISVIATVNVTPAIISTSPASRCDVGSVTLIASASEGIIDWYAVSTGGISLGTGISFTTPSLSSTTTYYVEATANGCTTALRTSVTATINALPVIVSENSTDVTTCGGSDGTITISATGTAPLTYSIDGGINFVVNGGNFFGLIAANYPIAVKNADGCIVIGSTIVVGTGGAPPAPTAGTDIAYCEGQTAADLSATAGSGGTLTWFSDPGLTIQIGTGVTLNPNIYLTAGTNDFYVTESVAGCQSVSSTVIITITAIPFIANVTPGSTCDAGIVTIGATASSGLIDWYDVSIGGTSIGTGSSFTTPFISSSTTYYADVTDNGCVAASRTAVLATVNVTPSITSILSASRCDAGTVNLAATASSGTIDWFASSTGGVSLSTGTSFITPNISSTTIYYVEATENGCTSLSRTEVIATINASPVSTASNNGPVCEGTLLTLSGLPDGMTNYSWTGPNGFSSTSQNPTVSTNAISAMAGTYTLTIINSDNCSATTTTDVTINQAITVNSGTDVTISYGTSTLLNSTVTGGSGSYIFSWTPSASLVDANIQNPATVALTGTTVFDLTVIDNVSGCQGTDNITVFISGGPLAVSVNSTPTSICIGDVAQLDAFPSGGTGSYSYTWSSNPAGFSSGIANPVVSPSVTTDYTVLIDDGNTTATSTVTVTVNVLTLTYTSVDATTGNNGAIDLTVTGGITPYTYYWIPGAMTSEDISGLSAGVYTVLVTDANGCTVTIDVTINNSSCSLTASVVGTDVSCNGLTDGTADLTINNAVAPVMFNWSDNSSTEDLNNLAAGTYYVTVTDSNNCVINASIVINEPATIIANAVSSDASCGSSDGSVTLTVSGGTGTYTFLWSNGTTSQDLINITTGSYNVIITDANSCQTTVSANVSNIGAPTANFTTQATTCAGSCDGNAFVSASGGIGPYTYKWIYDNHLGSIATNLCAGSYIVSITDANLCVTLANVDITSPASVTIVANTANTVCGTTSGSISLTVNGGTGSYTYNWSNGETTASVSNLAEGSYSVNVFDANNCSASDTFVINSIGGPTVNLSFNNATCFNVCNGAAFVTANGGTTPYIYSWSNGQNGQFATNLCQGDYIVSVQDATGCIVTNLATITAPPDIIASVSTTDESSVGAVDGSVNVSVSGGTGSFTFQWSANAGGQTTQNAINLSAGVYSVTISDASGCLVTLTDTVNVITGIPTFGNEVISIFPNPTVGVLNINTNSYIKKVELSDMIGRILMIITDKQGNVQLDMSHYTPGVYMLRVNTLNKHYTQRILLKD